MRTTITNLSPRSRKAVAVVTHPASLAQSFGQECRFVADNGRIFRAVNCGSKGPRKSVFRVFTNMNGRETIRGNIVNTPYNPSPFVFHSWTSDNVQALIPSIGVKINGEVTYSDLILDFKILETTPAHSRYWMRKKHLASSLIFEFWLDVYSGDPVADFKSAVIWSDRTVPENSKIFDEIYLKCGEYLAIDFSKKYGCSQPVRDAQSNYVILLTPRIGFNDGSALTFGGRMLTFVDPSLAGSISDPHANNQQLMDDINSVKAAIDGPVLGCSHLWDGYWLAGLNIPRLVSNTLHQEEWNRFEASLELNEGWYAPRNLGLGRSPGATGDQEDFGTTKGTYVVSKFDPRHIYAYQYSVYADAYRGYMHYENGRELQLSAHPNWVTWYSVTHYHTGVSSDRLNKREARLDPESMTRYEGIDDEHYSRNNLAAYWMLTDDPLVDCMIRHISTTDLAAYRNVYPQYGAGATRAQGRTAGGWAHLSLCSEGETRDRFLQMLRTRWEKVQTNPMFAEQLQVRIFEGHGPDGRKPIFDERGSLLPTWSIWEHSLAVVGFYNALKVGGPNATNTELFRRLLRTVVEWGCFKEGSLWFFVDDMWYRDGGLPIPGELSRSNTKLTWSTGGVGTWTLAALMIAAEALPQEDPLRAKAIECCRYYTASSTTGTNKTDAEWWAAVRANAF